MAKIQKVKYFTKEKEKFINPKNMGYYKKYLQSNIIKNQDVKDTTYYTYERHMTNFLMWLGEFYGDIDLYSEEFMEDAVDIMEAYMMFCQETLKNHKKVINLKVSTVSSFFIWATKRGYVKYHPFKDRLDRMKKASEEQIINHYFLSQEQIEEMISEYIKKYADDPEINFEAYLVNKYGDDLNQIFKRGYAQSYSSDYVDYLNCEVEEDFSSYCTNEDKVTVNKESILGRLTSYKPKEHEFVAPYNGEPGLPSTPKEDADFLLALGLLILLAIFIVKIFKLSIFRAVLSTLGIFGLLILVALIRIKIRKRGN